MASGGIARRWPAPLTYLLLALVGQLGALPDLGRRTQCACGDLPQTDWFLGWTPHALLNGYAPWFSRALAAPVGVNLTWNTLLPLPGLFAAPVTVLAGPIAAHTLLAVLAFAGSATSMWWVAGRWTPWRPARFAAGLLYGFSPYLVGQGNGHLNLMLVALPPVVLLLLDDLLVRQQRPAWRTGGLLGLVALAQLLTTEEVLASTFLLCLLGLALLVLQHRSQLRGRLRHACGGLIVAAGVLTAGAAWPLSVQFLGPQRVTGPVQSATRFAADLFGGVVPTTNQLLGTAATRTWGGNAVENGSYLGLPLVLLLGWLAWRCRSVAVARWAMPFTVGAWLLSLGGTLHVGGRDTGLPLPFGAVARLPLFGNLAAVRLSLYVVLGAALLLAVGLDRWRPTWQAAPVAALCLLALLPAWPYRYVDAAVPAYFTSAAVLRVPAGSVAVTFPLARVGSSAPMDWQAFAGYRYASPGGYVITPLPSGRGTFRGRPLVIETVFALARGGLALPLPAGPVGGAVGAELRRLHVDSLLVPGQERGAGAIVSWLTSLLGRGPDEMAGGVSAWYDLDH